MCEKSKKVTKWLSSVFGDQPIPQYEVNTRTVDILHQLAVASDLRCNETALLIEDHKQKLSEYPADGAHLQDVVLQGVGLSTGSLSKPASHHLSALVASTMALGARDTSLGSLLPAVDERTNKLLESEKTDRRLDQELKMLRKRLGAILVLRKTLEEDINKSVKALEVENAKADEKLSTMGFVKEKSKDLSNRNKMGEDQLASRHMEKSLTHQALLELSEEVATLKKEIAPLTKKLEQYGDMSPSFSLAQVKIEETKMELAAIESQLERKVDLMNEFK